ncbi:ycaC protein [Abortiporus biennis]|nr:ycaC protein [Abortiporus biennis]
MQFRTTFITLNTVLAAVVGALANGFTYERLNKTDAILLVVDTQEGLFQIARDQVPSAYKSNILAHAELGKVFNLPVVLTTSADSGPNGPLPQEIIDMFPNSPFIRRNGEVNAWDNADFKKAVQSSGKKQVILAGITTDVCTAFLALSLREAGYTVFANSDGSGTFNSRVALEANDRMRNAGVNVLSMFAIACELMRDWRNTPGAKEMLPFFDKYLPEYGYLARAHDSAVTNGTQSGLVVPANEGA